MKKKIKSLLFAVFVSVAAISSVLTSCSDDDLTLSSKDSSSKAVDFVATFTDKQQKLLTESGYPYEETEQKNSWNNLISGSIPNMGIV